MKRILSLILTLILLLSLAACGASPSPGPSPDPDPASPGASSPDPALTALTALDREGDPGFMCALDGTRVLVQYGALSGEEGSEEQVYGTHLALVDTESDAVTATAALTDDESLLGVLPGGEILTCSDDDLTLNVYRDDLTLERAVPLPEGCTGSGVILDRFGGRLFCLEGDTLCEISPDSGSATPFTWVEHIEHSRLQEFIAVCAIAICGDIDIPFHLIAVEVVNHIGRHQRVIGTVGVAADHIVHVEVFTIGRSLEHPLDIKGRAKVHNAGIYAAHVKFNRCPI